MYDEDFLKRIGFSGFTHFRESDRDDLKRLTKVLFVDEGCFTIRLILKSAMWEIELFKYEGEQKAYDNYFKTQNPSLKQIIETLFT